MTFAPRGAGILFMYEPRFAYLVNELEQGGIDVLVLGRGIFDYLFQKHLHEYITKHSRNYGEYALHTYESYASERARYLTDCTRVARFLRKHLSASTVVLPKYNDDYTLELIQAFHDAGWTTIVYDREGTVTKRRLELIPAIVSRQAPACDYVIAYNETHKKFFERVFSLSKTPTPAIVVMGNPASDEWFRSDSLQQLASTERRREHREIAFFAFGEFSYVYDAEYLKDRVEVWRGLLSDVHDVLTEHLRNHPQAELLYKRGAKGNRDYWPGSEQLLTLPNAHLVPSSSNAHEVIARSDFVLAFQTTALIDAMHTTKVLIYCAWGDNYQALKAGLLDFEDYARRGALLHARCPDELKRFLLLDPRDVPINLAARREIRETFTTNPDGLVAKRCSDWVGATFFSDRYGRRQRGGTAQMTSIVPGGPHATSVK